MTQPTNPPRETYGDRARRNKEKIPANAEELIPLKKGVSCDVCDGDHYPSEHNGLLDQQIEDATQDFEGGPEDHRRVDDDGPPGPDDEAPPLTARGGSTNGPNAQTGFGDHVVNVVNDEGIKLLELLEERAELKERVARFTEINADIRKQLNTRGLYKDGKAVRVRVGAHILNITDKSPDKPPSDKPRTGSQKTTIVHPDPS